MRGAAGKQAMLKDDAEALVRKILNGRRQPYIVPPSGGTVEDMEARAVLALVLSALQKAGILESS